MRRFASALGTAAGLILISSFASAQISGTAHDFKSGGSSAYKGTSDQICIYCHAPHGTGSQNNLIWNRTNSSSGDYTLYNNTATGVTATSVANSTLNCMSCHDGTQATGAVVTTGSTATDLGGAAIGTTAAAYLSTDLSDDHPVGVTFNTGATGFKTPTNAKAVDGKVECTSCHDPHTSVSSFLLAANTGSALCLDCHVK